MPAPVVNTASFELGPVGSVCARPRVQQPLSPTDSPSEPRFKRQRKSAASAAKASGRSNGSIGSDPAVSVIPSE